MIQVLRLLAAALALTAAPLTLTPVIDRRRRRALRSLVPRVCAVLDRHDIPYWADFGTLLGYCRERDIIVSDKDADLCVLGTERNRIAALASAFGDAGMELTNSGGRSRRVLRIFDARTRYHVDIYTYTRVGDLLRSDLHSPNEDIPAALVERCERVSFLGGTMLVPAEVDAVLKYRYGDQYLTPRRGDKGKTRPHSRVRSIAEDIEAAWVGIWSWLRSLSA